MVLDHCLSGGQHNPKEASNLLSPGGPGPPTFNKQPRPGQDVQRVLSVRSPGDRVAGYVFAGLSERLSCSGQFYGSEQQCVQPDAGHGAESSLACATCLGTGQFFSCGTEASPTAEFQHTDGSHKDLCHSAISRLKDSHFHPEP